MTQRPADPIKRQCTGHRRDGARCRRSANRGATVCNSHGGAAPQVRAAAVRRQAEAQAAEVLGRWVPPLNGQSADVDVVAELARLVARSVSLSDYLTEHLAMMEAAEWAAPSEVTQARVHIWQVTVAQLRGMLVDVARLGIDLDPLAIARRTGDACGWVVVQVLTRHGLPVRSAEIRAELAEQFRAIPSQPWYQP